MARETTDPTGRTGIDGSVPEGHPAEAFLITHAETSLEEQHRARVRKYLLMMSIRVPALVLAGLVYVWTENPWWSIAIIALSIPLPWAAVLIANDRPPRERGEVQYYRYGGGQTVGPAALAAEPAPRPEPERPVIDGEAIERHDDR
ncbi:MAG: DUF3099 domain-containing protein [Gordonia sp. (in: high G+C Gram-positive bacteria)]|uniref:DUF3099 domain-containing protein n=1 Tax=Gordonia sp. (in: high G+C Gram-positive bacteria) TaxID=84139 RepID=UPI0039E24E8D